MALFQSEGTMPEHKDKFMICVNEGGINGAASFKSELFISS